MSLSLLVLLLPVARAGARPQDEQPEHAEGVHRIGQSADPVVAAVEIARAAFADGAAVGAVVGRDDVFADTLAGAALAGASRPLLFTTGGPSARLRPEVAAEIARAVGRPRGCGAGTEVYVLGGPSAVSPVAAEAIARAGYCVRRVAGSTRVETAVQIAEIVLASRDRSRILVARSDNPVDAATGGAWAAATRTPVVVTQPGSLHPAVAALLERHYVDSAVLLGGGAALFPAVERAVAARVGSTTRVAGAARDGTAAQVAHRLWGSDGFAGALVLNGYDSTAWARAQAAAVYSARTGRPQLWTSATSLPAVTAELTRGRERITVVGSARMVGDAVVENLMRGLGGPAPPGVDRAMLYSGDPLQVVNYFRDVGGVPRLHAFDATLSRAAYEHARYTVEASDPGHRQDPASPWSTPAGRHELPGTAGAEVYFEGFGPGEEDDALLGWMRTPFHGLMAVSPRFTTYGIGAYRNRAAPQVTSATVMRASGWSTEPVRDDGVRATFPADGAVLPTTTFWEGGESPDPLALCGYRQPAGQAVWVTLARPPRQVQATSLTGPSGPLPHCLLDVGDTQVLFPRDPLPPGARIVASLTADGRTAHWSFRVARVPIDR